MLKRSTTNLTQANLATKKPRLPNLWEQDADEENMHQVLSVLWNVNEATAVDKDKKFHEPVLDNDSVYSIGYILGKSYANINKVQTLTEERPGRHYRHILDHKMCPEAASALISCVRKIYVSFVSADEESDGVLYFTAPDHSEAICAVLESFFNIRTLIFSNGAIAYNSSNATNLIEEVVCGNGVLALLDPADDDSDASIEF
jgi:hypothetical protein